MKSEAEMVSGQPVEESGVGELAAALAKAQGMMENAQRNQENPAFSRGPKKNKYADLAAIWDACRKPLSENGLAVVQQVDSDETGITISTRLIHTSGQEIRAHLWLPVSQRTAQAYGSAITYGRRYGLAALVGVVADEDDDGNSATFGDGAPAKAEPSKAEPDKGKKEGNKSSKLTAKLQADDVVREQPQATEPKRPRLEFGPRKGSPLDELPMEQLSAALDEAHKRLREAEPGAAWVGKLRANKADIEAEVSRRMSEAAPTQAQMEMGQGV